MGNPFKNQDPMTLSELKQVYNQACQELSTLYANEIRYQTEIKELKEKVKELTKENVDLLERLHKILKEVTNDKDQHR